MSSEMLDLFLRAFGETLLMVGVAGLLGGLIGYRWVSCCT
jgi:ABC-type methionine transport system permease subunit